MNINFFIYQIIGDTRKYLYSISENGSKFHTDNVHESKPFSSKEDAEQFGKDYRLTNWGVGFVSVTVVLDNLTIL